MRSLFWVLALFALAVGVSLVTRYNEGYVLFFYPPYRLEMNLSLFIGALVVAFLVLLGLMKLAAQLVGFPSRVKIFREAKRTELMASHVERAVQAYLVGEVDVAKEALRVAKSHGAAGATVERLEAALARGLLPSLDARAALGSPGSGSAD
jgi:HemY protein